MIINHKLKTINQGYKMKNTNTIITIVSKGIRKIRNREDYNVTIEYVTSKGEKHWVRFIEKSLQRAKNQLNFRLVGLTNSATLVKIG
jgi:hypothetical protein